MILIMSVVLTITIITANVNNQVLVPHAWQKSLIVQSDVQDARLAPLKNSM